jgi:hypothetical protein
LVLRKTLSVVENISGPTPSLWTPALVNEARAKLFALTAVDEARKANEGE